MEGTTTKTDLRRSSRAALISARERNSLFFTRTKRVVKKEDDNEKTKKKKVASKRIPRSRRLTLTEYKTVIRRLGHVVQEETNSNDYFSVKKIDEKWRPLVTFPEGDVSISDESSVGMIVSPHQPTTARFIPRPASSSSSSSYSHSSSSPRGYSDSETETPLPAGYIEKINWNAMQRYKSSIPSSRLYTPIQTDSVAVQKLFVELTKSREEMKEEENEEEEDNEEEENESDAESYFDFDVAEEQ